MAAGGPGPAEDPAASTEEIVTSAADDAASTSTALKEAYRQLARAAHHDWLTGLPSRPQLLERLVSLDGGRLLSTALLFIDLDDFKDVNDTYGHGEGDDLLRHVADRLRGCIRPGDVLARLGGDEFAILLEGATTAAAEELARSVLQAMVEPFVVSGEPRWITASVGVAVGAVADIHPHELLRFADLAMYDAKARGKNRFSRFETAMSDALILRTRTEGDLRQAIDGEQLRLHYQPIVSLTSGRMVGVEALVRWEHPVRGLLAPVEFVPLAERTGAIIPLGRWVLTEACRQAERWRASHPHVRPLVMSVNVSARQLDHPAFLSNVSETLEGTGLDPSSLCLEVTESAVVANLPAVQSAAKDLRRLGVRLSIDDFGTGYASLTYLRRLHASEVKVDRSFVDGLGHELEDTTIVTAVISLAHAMGLSVTAEGVETERQLRILAGLQCQNAQGYLLCRPAPAEDITSQLERHWPGCGPPGQ